MFLRVFIIFITILFCTSCDKFWYTKNNDSYPLDTIVDFSSVDTSPSFKICDSIFDKTKKSDCFRNSIHQKIGEQLQRSHFVVKESIDEIIFVDLIINSQGNFMLDHIQSSKSIQKKLPQLDSLLKSSIGKLPKIYPANKRGIPVTTKYRLPISIQLKE
jgi:uncharacterized membrane protein YwzB